MDDQHVRTDPSGDQRQLFKIVAKLMSGPVVVVAGEIVTIPTWFTKDCANVFVPVFMAIINISIPCYENWRSAFSCKGSARQATTQ